MGRARNNGRSTDNVRQECGVVWSNSYLAGHFDRSLSVLIIKIKLSSIIIKNHNMLSNVLRVKNFKVRHKVHGHVFKFVGEPSQIRARVKRPSHCLALFVVQ
jgi:hypothetical protein